MIASDPMIRLACQAVAQANEEQNVDRALNYALQGLACFMSYFLIEDEVRRTEQALVTAKEFGIRKDGTWSGQSVGYKY